MQSVKSTSRLLVVDDENVGRLFVKRTLEERGYQIDGAHNGLAALDMLNQQVYALAIVDLNMPGMNGEQLIKQIRQQDKFIALIVLTAQTDIELSFRLLEQYDIADYLMKPMFHELQLQLRFSVHNALSRRRFLINQRRYVDNLEYLKHQAEVAKSCFLAQMNHELNTPMNAILGFGQLLEGGDNDLNEQQQGYVKQIINAGWSLMSMIDNILKLSSIDFDITELKITTLTLDTIIDEITQELTLQTQNKLINLTNQPSQLKVSADLTQLKFIIHCLINNAITYNIAEGNVTICAQQTEKQMVRLMVTDTGIGIDQDKLEQLFTPFNRLGAELKTISGAGVSLALSARSISAMQGKIGCNSVKHQGSTFWIELPCV